MLKPPSNPTLKPIQPINQLLSHEFNGHAVRVFGTPEHPLFVTADIATILEIQNIRQSLAHLDEDETGVCSTYTSSENGIEQRRNLAAVTESSLYTLILRCRDAVTPGTKAHSFRKWVTSEVIPAIRKHGGYLIRCSGSDYNMPTQKAMKLGLFDVKETAITHSDGHVGISKTAKATGKGQVYFINHFLSKEAA